jgi:hypothetical protein
MPHRHATKSPLQLARAVYAVAQRALDKYSHPRARRDFTQAQLFSLLLLRQFFQTDYRGLVQLVSEFSELRRVLELETVPHFTTLQKAEKRLLKKGPLSASWTLCLNAPPNADCSPMTPLDLLIPPDLKAVISVATF